MIHLDQLSFGYRKGQLLFNKLNLHLEAGYIYGLLGKNGAGKSSLLRNIAGLLYPDQGSIKVGHFNPRERKPAFLQNIYFVAEEIYLPAVTIEKYLAVQAPFYPKFDKAQFRYYLTEFDVSSDSYISNLSFGQRKKVLIAFALACNTDVLIMDEPTNGLDIPSKKQFRKLLASAIREDQLMLISTHQVRDLDNLIDSVIVLEDREILLHQPLHRISEQLRFATLNQAENDHRVLYAEPSLQGYTVVMENLEQQESKVDLERLFNAATQNPERIRQLFN
ncbi:ABC transporter ATP-binding protein [Tunicatimonas pelagia]|uniref:ABC transporter ATP-binding protein n=1 Tax=Tunicatimonas pelagia TaxID=931531 RepID=UPI002665F0E5|nr:ABC transporter ATP-binding protein [Tunicatimonas pelagia]WKN44019.1 ABC transporter ATP-binding protein [Tunicatimonas pelagia]